MRVPAIADMQRLAELALQFGRINRTHVYHPDTLVAGFDGAGGEVLPVSKGGEPESNADHTVMLGWLATALATELYPDRLSPGLVAIFALFHDMPEVYAGDTPTLRISAQEYSRKEDREARAVRRLSDEMAASFPMVGYWLRKYEAQDCPEARFVWALDKLLPKFVHLLDGARGLREIQMGRAEFLERMRQQRERMASRSEFVSEIWGKGPEFQELISVHHLLCLMVERLLPEEAGS